MSAVTIASALAPSSSSASMVVDGVWLPTGGDASLSSGWASPSCARGCLAGPAGLIGLVGLVSM